MIGATRRSSAGRGTRQSFACFPTEQQVHDDAHEDVFILRAALGNHQGQRHQRTVGHARQAVRLQQGAIAIEEPEEQRRRNALVPIEERVVLDQQIKQLGCFLFETRIQLPRCRTSA